MFRLHRIAASAVLVGSVAALLGLAVASPALAHPGHDATHVVAASTTAVAPGATTLTSTRPVNVTPRLTGDQEVGVVASKRGSVSVTFRLNPKTGTVKFRKLVPNLLFEREDEFGPTKFHIHRGVEGQNGPVVIDMTSRRRPGSAPVVGSPPIRTLVAEIAAHPENFYVNYHTISHPDGAVRGQLG